MPQHPALYLRKKSAEAVKQGYPWVYASDVKESSVVATIEGGELVTLCDERGVKLATGYIDRGEKRLARVLSRQPDRPIDGDFFAYAFSLAEQRRASLSYGNYLRLVHAESDYLPGLTIDRFGGVFVCQYHTEGMRLLFPLIEEALRKLYQPKAIVRRTQEETMLALGTFTDPVVVEEYGVQFLANLATGQKSGWYYDQRENRHLLAGYTKGKRFLDGFCYTGGFGIAAAEAGAAEVTFLDRSEEAMKLAVQAVQTYPVKTEAICGKAFEEMEKLVKMKRLFDVISLDPPPFIKNKQDKANGIKGYAKTASLGLQLIAPKGLLFFASCSHHMGKADLKKVIQQEANRLKRPIVFKAYQGAAKDHPVHPLLPQTEYLHGYLVATTS